MFEFLKKWFGKKDEMASGTGNPDTATTLALTTDTTSDGEDTDKPKDPGAVSGLDDYGGGEDFDFD